MSDSELLGNENLGTKLIKKSFWLYFFMIFTAPIGYIIKVIVSNKMSVEDIGLFYSILGLISLISVYNDLGLTEALQYYLPKYWIERKYNNYKTILYLTFFLQLISGIVIGGALYLGADWLAINHFHSANAMEIIKLFSLYFLLINFLQAFGNFYSSFQDTFSSSIIESTRIFSVLTFTVLFWLNNSLNNFTFGISRMVGLSIAVLISVIIFIKKYSYTLKLGKFEPSKSLIKTQLKYAFWVFLAANVGTLFGQINQQIVVHTLGTQSAGYYANFLSLITIFAIVTGPVLGLLFPIVTELITKKDNYKLEMLQNIMYKYFSIFTISISGIFMVFGEEIATILFGVKFAYSGVLLVYCAPFLVFNILFSINYGILAGLGKVKERVKILFWGLLANILICIPFVYFFKLGLIGVLFSMFAGRFILWILSFRYINQNQKITFDRKYFIGNLLTISFISFVFYYFKDQFFILNNNYRYQNITYLLIAMLLYYLVLAGINYKSILILVKEVKNMIGKK